MALRLAKGNCNTNGSLLHCLALISETNPKFHKNENRLKNLFLQKITICSEHSPTFYLERQSVFY